MDNRLINIIKDLYSIPNAPYSIKARTTFIKNFVEKLGLNIEDTTYFLKVNLNETTSKKKIIFMSHLDHPGFVFKNNRFGKAFGSLYLHKVHTFKPISIYSPEGKYLGDAQFVRSFGRDESNVEIKAHFFVPKNSQGLWNVGEVRIDNEKIYGRSHDNDIATALMLYSLKEIKNTGFQFIFVFTKHEEVLQQSSYNLTINNSLGIVSDDIVINLESMKVYPITNDSKFSNLNYTNGSVLNISEANCIYRNTGQNLAESLINNISDEISITLQHGLAGGTSDARVICSNLLTQNIVTINIPNQFKHNSDGESIIPEEILIKDVLAVSKIIQTALSNNLGEIRKNTKDLSEKINLNLNEIDKEKNNFYLKINKRLDIANKDIIKRGHYYPTTILEITKDLYFKSLSYLAYAFSRSVGEKNLSKD